MSAKTIQAVLGMVALDPEGRAAYLEQAKRLGAMTLAEMDAEVSKILDAAGQATSRASGRVAGALSMLAIALREERTTGAMTDAERIAYRSDLFQPLDAGLAADAQDKVAMLERAAAVEKTDPALAARLRETVRDVDAQIAEERAVVARLGGAGE